jgi:oxygen-independent coproporphyrinogen III oxidase
MPGMRRLPTLSGLTASPLPAALSQQGKRFDAVYVHVPFCTRKCHYCDFYSVAGHLEEADAFLETLAGELDLHLAFFGPLRPRTVFIGGGTPTLLPPELLQRLLELLRRRLDLSAVVEFTVEANPNTFDGTRARVLAAGGVNRISFGAQSFNPSELRMLQRDHDPESVAAAFAAARRAGLVNLSVDLIFGIPGQTVATWEYSLGRALELEPSHMSCYSLVYEPNTAMTLRMRAGDFARLDEETELAMFEHVYRRLRAAGFERYETSNYARAAPCRHNLIYWKAGNWLGLGPSAGSHVAIPEVKPGESEAERPVAWQWKNAGSLAHYLEALQPGAQAVPLTQLEPLPRTTWAAGAAVFWLRLNEGLCYEEFAARTGVDARPALRAVLAPYVELGLAELTANAARITDRGVAVSDHILRRVLAALEGERTGAVRSTRPSPSPDVPAPATPLP